jgi:hypothetical protein
MDFVAPVNIKQQTGQIYATLMHLHLPIHNNNINIKAYLAATGALPRKQLILNQRF